MMGTEKTFFNLSASINTIKNKISYNSPDITREELYRLIKLRDFLIKNIFTYNTRSSDTYESFYFSNDLSAFSKNPFLDAIECKAKVIDNKVDFLIDNNFYVNKISNNKNSDLIKTSEPKIVYSKFCAEVDGRLFMQRKACLADKSLGYRNILTAVFQDILQSIKSGEVTPKYQQTFTVNLPKQEKQIMDTAKKYLGGQNVEILHNNKALYISYESLKMLSEKLRDCITSKTPENTIKKEADRRAKKNYNLDDFTKIDSKVFISQNDFNTTNIASKVHNVNAIKTLFIDLTTMVVNSPDDFYKENATYIVNVPSVGLFKAKTSNYFPTNSQVEFAVKGSKILISLDSMIKISEKIDEKKNILGQYPPKNNRLEKF